MRRVRFNILVLFRKEQIFVFQSQAKLNSRSTPSWDTAFSEAHDEEVDREAVDQDILKEAGDVIPNISFYDEDEIFIE